MRRSAYRGDASARRHSVRGGGTRDAAAARHQRRRRGRLRRARPDGVRHRRRDRAERRPRPTRTRPSGALRELVDLGLAAELSPRAVAGAAAARRSSTRLRAQRLSELEMATVAAESLQSHLLAASQQRRRRRHPDRASAARRSSPRGDEICDERQEGDLRLRQAAVRRSRDRTPPSRRSTKLAGVAGPGARESRCAASTTRVRQRPAGRARPVRREGRAVADRAGADEADPGRRPGRADPVDAVLQPRPRAAGLDHPAPACWSRRCMAVRDGLGRVGPDHQRPASTRTTRAARC